MTRYLAGTVISCLMLAGCVTADQPAQPLTLAQKYYATDRAYESVLTAAVEYHDDCIRTPDPLKGNCWEIVQATREMNREAQDIRTLAEMAIADGDPDLLEEATGQLEALRDRLRQQVLDQMARDAELQQRRG